MLLLLCACCHSLLAGPELLLPIGPSLLEILSPRLLWLLNPLPFPWQLCVFGSGTKLLEDFESLTGAAVPHYWLWTSGPRCCPHPALGCTLLAKTLLFCRGKAASTMETVTGSKEITTVCIIINNSRSLYWRLLLIFSFDRSLLKDQTCFRKGECKHYFISLLWVLSGALLPLFIFSFSLRKEECFLFVNRCKVLACAKMPGIWPPHMLSGHGLHVKQEKCRELGQWILGSNWQIKKKSQTLQEDKDYNENKGKGRYKGKTL